MTLISKEDVQKILLKHTESLTKEDRHHFPAVPMEWILIWAKEEINSLTTFHDPIKIIEEMIDEYNTMIPSDALETLQEAISRITKQ